MRLQLISCEIFYREMCACAAVADNQVDINFLPYGLHSVGTENMRARLQEEIDRIEPDKYEAILMGYGLCNNGIAGLLARHTPLIVPRAHDCITLFFGSKEKYQEYFDAHPGVYFQTTGWIERGEDAGEMNAQSIQEATGMNMTYEQLVAQYGEDNAKYLYEELCQPLRNYSQYTFISTGIEKDDRWEKRAREKADEQGWTFSAVQGNLELIHRLLDGPWDNEDFLTVKPGQHIVARYDQGIIAAEPETP